MTCGLCGLTYGAMWSHGELWYRCGGQTRYRASRARALPWEVHPRLQPRTAGVGRRGALAAQPWRPLGRASRRVPGHGRRGTREAEREVAEKGLADIPRQRDRILDAYKRGRIDPDTFDAEMDTIAVEKADYEATLAALTEPEAPEDDMCVDLLLELRRRLDERLR